jgi:hypothetical protein
VPRFGDPVICQLLCCAALLPMDSHINPIATAMNIIADERRYFPAVLGISSSLCLRLIRKTGAIALLRPDHFSDRR